MISVSTWTLLAILGASGETVLLDFTAPWCGPCQSMEPVIHRLQSEGFPVRQVNIDQNPQLAAKYGVRSVPCFVMLVNGHEVDRVVGAVGHDRLAQMFSAARFSTRQENSHAEIRGQSPDRLGLAGRFRQMVGGGRAEGAAPQQPPTAPPSSFSNEPPAYSSGVAEMGPEPPAALGSFASPTPEASVHAPNIPAMAPNYQAGPVAGAAIPTSMVTPPTQASAAVSTSPEEHALAASVRLRIDDGQFFSYATGSVVSVQPDGEALILTCGHVFRESQGRGVVQVETFGASRQGPLEGRLIAYDLDRDLGLVGVRGASGLEPVTISGREAYVREGLRAFSIGCDRGAEPTLREGRVAGVNRYLGTPNLVVTGRPVVGRSGGGLFDSEGRLLGVCRAADGQADEGVYVSYQAIHDQLAAWSMSNILQGEPQTNVPAKPLAAAEVASDVAGDVATITAPLADRPADFDYTQVPAGQTRSEQSIGVAPGPGGMTNLPSSTEPVFIVRAGNGGGKVMLLEQPSPAFLEQLARESKINIPEGVDLPGAVRTAAESARRIPSNQGLLMRGQSPLQSASVSGGGPAIR